MNVFRFYFILIGIIAAGIAKLYGDGEYLVPAVLAALIPIFSYFFWRLDIRSADLIKISERHLSITEKYLEPIAGKNILFTEHANNKDNEFARRYNTEFLFSFRKIITLTFFIVGLLGATISVYLFTSPLASQLQVPPSEEPAGKETEESTS